MAAILAAGPLLSSLAPAHRVQAAESKQVPPQPAPTASVMCVATFLNLAAEVGRRCVPDEDPALQAELRRAVARTDAFILRNSPMTEAELAEFKKTYALTGASKEVLCQGDPLMAYRAFQKGGVDRLRANTDEMLAQPRDPRVGECV